ncbi:MAG: hypothetical protein EYC70_06995 [Planctomycetota bacterium]|nr:MAG: hypothetical protein EYC70_06995 [Planctomycetota bacterium]
MQSSLTCSRSLQIGQFLAFLATYQLLVLNLHAQSCGGEIDQIYRLDAVVGVDELGHAVSCAGDVNGDGFDDLIAGAPYSSPGGMTLAGSAFVYSGPTGALLYSYDGSTTQAFFGISVSGVGDVNTDGFDDFIVGESQNSNGGSAFVYSGMTGALLYRFDGQSVGDSFGWSVSGAGDVNGDGVPDLIVGARYADSLGAFSDAGSAYVFSGATGNRLYRIDGQNNNASLGWSVSDAGDVNADGFADFAVGAPNAVVPMGGAFPRPGSVFVHSGANGSLLYRLDGEDNGDDFGIAVSGLEDISNDGFDDLVIGAYRADPNGLTYAGSAYLYSGATGVRLQRFDGDNAYDYFGGSVSGAGDVNGDGFGDFLVGADHADPGGASGAGSVFLYSGAAGYLLARLDGELAGDELGASVSGAGNTDGDGIEDIVVGATGVGGGAVYLYASFAPFLHTDAYSISAVTGGRVNYFMDFPDSEGGVPYVLLGSLTGTGPWSVGGGCIPLTFDAFTQRMASTPPPIFRHSAGTLGAGGTALAWMDVPPNWLSGYVGVRLWFAAVAYVSSIGLHYTSVAVPLDIAP